MLIQYISTVSSDFIRRLNEMNFSGSSYTKFFYDLEKIMFPCGSNKGLFLIMIVTNASILLPKHCYI